MVRAVVVIGVIVAVVFSGGALADVSSTGLVVTLRRAGGHTVTAKVTRATDIRCASRAHPRPRRCGLSDVTPGAVVVRVQLRRGPGGVRLVRRLELIP